MKKITSTFLSVIGLLAIVLSISAGLAFKSDYFEINKQLELFTAVFKEVNLYYVDETEPAEMMEKAVEGMLKNLDPYTVYIPESKVEDFRMMQTGQYGGIGSTIRQIDNKVLIAEPHEGFPADKAGLQAGDWIKAIDGINMVGKSTEEVSRILKGTPGKEVELTFERDGKENTLTLKREEIQLKSVPYYGMITENTGYIYLSSFTDKATIEIKEALQELKKDENFSQVILDLRGNPGGLLNQAVDITNLFVEKGTEVVSTKGKLKQVDQTYKTLRNPFDTEIPLAVLINGSSASASEIVAGSIQDLDRGIVVGQRSFGKGLVQQSHPLQYESQIKITIAKYYTPSGRCIQAINYAERDDDGRVSRLPDSLRTEFKTRNGRSVFDGAGVDPDLFVEGEEASDILISLVNNGHVFNYATEFVRTHQTIVGPGEFALSDEEYEAFVKYLQDKHYAYTTQTEKEIKRLKTAAENENYEGLDDEIAQLEKEAEAMKSDDLTRYKAQISEYLAQEIVGRYYYKGGKIRQSLKGDPIIEEALKNLNDKEKYNQIRAVAI
jgi:carboxyl-terminal processing protease